MELELQIQMQCPLVVTAVNSGTSVVKAVLTTGISRSFFYKYRSWIAEIQIKIVESQHYEHLRE
jgi:ACT domain-containing protein